MERPPAAVRRQARGVHPAQLSARPYKLACIIPDLHVPHEDKRSVAAVEQYLADEHWDYWCCLGDLVDHEAISSFNVGKPRKVANAPTIMEQFSDANRFLDRHLDAARRQNPDCECAYIEGNHEERTERYVDKNPELAGLVDVERALRLRERKVEYVRFWSRGDLYKLGKLYLGHGAFAVQNHAAKHVRDFGCNLVVGHTHDLQYFSVRQRGKNQTIACQSLGCMCNLEQPYMKGRPTNWQTAFGVVFVFESGHFQLVPVPIHNYRFVAPTSGRVYAG